MKRVSRRRQVNKKMLPEGSERITDKKAGIRVWRVPGRGKFASIAMFVDGIRVGKEKTEKSKKKEDVQE